MKCYYCKDKFLSLKGALDHHFKCHVDLPMKIWTTVEINGKYRYKTRTYSSVIPQDITKSGKPAHVYDSANIVICSISSTTPSIVLKKKPASADSPAKQDDIQNFDLSMEYENTDQARALCM